MQAVERYRVSDTVLVPTMVSMLIEHPAFGKYDLSSFQNFVYGASPMPLPLLKETMAKLPNTRFRQGYGMTETSPLLTVLEHEDHFGPAVSFRGKTGAGNRNPSGRRARSRRSDRRKRRNHRTRPQRHERLLEAS